MPIILLLLLLGFLAGCGPNTPPSVNNLSTQSDPNAYVLQSVVHPLGWEPNFTPYGTPVNAGTSGEYDRSIRPDAISDYGQK
ncbi:hypothetical protein [Brevibacillus migulae]|uniref:hypothetical protein n=1 Tax=Brevibacillus migulae TaxID=1644114 RepID=UPI00106E0F47|nr:hypothetical protein [Brevibacillus migulae]